VGTGPASRYRHAVPKGKNDKAQRQQRILDLLGTFTDYPENDGGMTSAEMLEALTLKFPQMAAPRLRTVQRDLEELGGPRGPDFSERTNPAAPNDKQRRALEDEAPDAIVHHARRVWYTNGIPTYYGYRPDRGSALLSDFRSFADYDLRHYVALLLPPEAAKPHLEAVEAAARKRGGTAKQFERWRQRVADRTMMRQAEHAIDSGIRAAVYEALYLGKLLQLRYAARKGDEERVHRIAPLGLVIDIGRTTLLGRTFGKRGLTHALYKFHLHRIREAMALDESIDPAVDGAFDMQAYLASGDLDFKVSGNRTLDVEAILLSEKVSRGILEDEPIAPNQQIVEEGGALVVRASAIDTWALRRKLLTYLPYVVFRKPDPLIPPYAELDAGRAKLADEHARQRLVAMKKAT
jgi:predicted DNA-binding transcriptional regulator YafY